YYSKIIYHYYQFPKINMKLDDFKEAWKNISDKILESLAVEVNPENIKNISKLISQICIEETDIKNISDLLTTGNRAVMLWGPPGTGKTYESEAVVKELLEVSDDEEFEERYLFSKGDMSRNDKGYYEIVQFHSKYTYQDFIGGISPKLDGDNNIGYELREGVFKRFCDEASKKENEQKKFIFIIDEINRAELSAVFGELLYALEYRGKSINLPHFGEFTIPKNLYIIGTMNNVDKSLVTFDLALRRRFGFFKLMPKLEVMQEVLSEFIEDEDKSLSKYYEKCKKLNEDIVKELDLGEDYQIGQAYFLKIRDFLQKNENEELIKNQNITSFELEKLWVYNIEPLLEEYLGMSIEDDGVKNKLKSLKEEFLKDN
ncbi:MAG: McrB family protein, partial [Campylobacterales bacterium]